MVFACTLTGTNVTTGDSFQVSSYSLAVTVLPQTGLRFTLYTASQVATVGQVAYVNTVYSNTGRTTFTNIWLNCYFETCGTNSVPILDSSDESGRVGVMMVGDGVCFVLLSFLDIIYPFSRD